LNLNGLQKRNCPKGKYLLKSVALLHKQEIGE
jgi:hypothetical protein